MRLSTRTRYGMRAMLELALHHGQGPLQIKIIAQKQDISVKYLEQLISILKTGGFVRGIRGSKGGYVLAKDPKKIKLSDIFRCLEGPIVAVECLENKNYCTRVADCVTRELWLKVQEAVLKVLQPITLQDLVNRAKGNNALNYNI